ncbi:MAG: PilZ domain-containing protein [Geobacteraceae bacterium]|nr:PilZ domain-containing protein [Geobacteraceae bacterium]
MAGTRISDRKRKRIALCFGADESTSRRAFTEDLSPLGLFIKTANVCNPNTVLRIELLVDDQPICLDARVMWAKRVPQNLFHLVKKSGMGVRIIRFHAGRDRYMGLCEFQDSPVPGGGVKHV